MLLCGGLQGVSWGLACTAATRRHVATFSLRGEPLEAGEAGRVCTEGATPQKGL